MLGGRPIRLRQVICRVISIHTHTDGACSRGQYSNNWRPSRSSVVPCQPASPPASQIPIEIESRCKPGARGWIPFHGIGLTKRNRIDTLKGLTRGTSSFPLFCFQTRATILSSSFIFISGQDAIAKHDPNPQPGCLGFTRLLETGKKRQRRPSWWCAYINVRSRELSVSQ